MKEIPKGWREISNQLKEHDAQLTLDSLKESIMNMFSADKPQDFTYLRYCPHEDTIVLFSTNPIKGCPKCIDELIKTI